MSDCQRQRLPAAQAAQPAAQARARHGSREGKRAERRLGWLLCAPAAIVMLAVTAYPILYSVWLSLQRSDLKFPDDQEFIGLANYVTVLTNELLVDRVRGDRADHRGLGGDRARARHGAGADHAPDARRRAAWCARRRSSRTASSPSSPRSPGGTRGRRAPATWPNLFAGGAPLTERASALAIIILAEIWKTTPFMALLLMAGLALVPEDLLKAASMDGATRLAAVHPGDAAGDEAGDPGRAAVPHARRVPGLRQHLRADRRRQRHVVGVDAHLQQPDQGPEPRHRLHHVGADLHHGRDHRVRLRQAVRHRRARQRRRGRR